MRKASLLGATLCCYLVGAPPRVADAATTTPTARAVHHDVSPSLRNIPPPPTAKGVVHREHPVKRLPPLPTTKGPKRPDTSLQTRASRSLSLALKTTFPGIGNGTSHNGTIYTVSSDPPDTNGAVGTTQYVEWVNTAFAVFDKNTGNRTYGPVDGSILWHGFGGSCEKYNDGDPIVQYDKSANRWVMTQFAVSTKPYSQCIAVSRTPDALGPYARYEFQFSDMNDYPKFGVWPDAYYASFNMFKNGKTIIGGKACAFERSMMLLGASARMKCFDTPESGLLPADVDGRTEPPPGAPEVFMNFGVDRLNEWRFHVDWMDPSRSTFTGPISIPVSPFQEACESCIAQPGTDQTLDTLGDRLMYRLAFRRFGSHDSLFVNHAVQAPSNSVAVRWYEVRFPFTQPTLAQQGTFAPDAVARWIGSMATDRVGNVLLGYSASGKSVYPSIRFTGRSALDPPGILAAESILVPGAGSQTNPSRWGDYSSVTVDPTDDCTFWFTTQYLAANGEYNWQTRIARVRYANCK